MGVYLETAAHLRQDVSEFWKRHSFFLLVEGGLFSVFVASGADDMAASVDRAAQYMPLLGGLIAVIWLWIGWWSVKWIARWYECLRAIEAVIDPWESHLRAGFGTRVVMDIQGWASTLPALFTAGWIFIGWHTFLPWPDGVSVGAILLIASVAVVLWLVVAWRKAKRTYEETWETRPDAPLPGTLATQATSTR
jgi:hypothetical protein